MFSAAKKADKFIEKPNVDEKSVSIAPFSKEMKKYIDKKFTSQSNESF